MGRPKGTKKTGGRCIGTPNKVTMDLRSWIKMLIDENMPQLEADLQALEPKERWGIIEKLLNYALPKMQSIEAKVAAEVGNTSKTQLTTEEQERFKRVKESPYNPHDFKNAGLDRNYNKENITPEEAAIFIKEVMYGEE